MIVVMIRMIVTTIVVIVVLILAKDPCLAAFSFSGMPNDK